MTLPQGARLAVEPDLLVVGVANAPAEEALEPQTEEPAEGDVVPEDEGAETVASAS